MEFDSNIFTLETLKEGKVAVSIGSQQFSLELRRKKSRYLIATSSSVRIYSMFETHMHVFESYYATK
jgi:hypothetical protein